MERNLNAKYGDKAMVDSSRTVELQKMHARRIGRAMNCINALFIILLIVGALIAAVVTFIFKPESEKNSSKYYGKIVYFAIFLGDAEIKPESYKLSDAANKCSFTLNIDNIRHSIDGMEHTSHRYSFITYDESTNVSTPLEADQARHKLIDFRSNGRRQFNQTAVIAEFERLAQDKEKDLLVYFIPCKYKYNQDDSDTKTFVKGLEKFPQRVLLVSNTDSESTVARVFNLTTEYVVGIDGNVPERTKHFCTKDPTTTTPPKSSTKITSVHSTPATHSPTTKKSPTAPTLAPEATTTVISTTSAAAAATTTTTFALVTNTTASTTTSITTTTTTTITTTTTPSTITTTEEPIGEVKDVHCLFAGDLLNFGKDTEAIEKEKYFIKRIADVLYNTVPNATAGIWAYGYTEKEHIKINSQMMHDNLVDFEASVNGKMLLQGQNPQIRRNDQPVMYVNAAEDKDHLANCVVFLSAVEQQKLHEFQGVKLNVTMKAKISRIVAVSLRSLDLSGIVTPPDGKAVKVSTDYTTEDVKRVTRAILVNFPKS